VKKLTDNQILAIRKLGNHPLVSSTGFSSHNGGNEHISIASKDDVNLSEILTVLSDIFPAMAVEIAPFNVGREDGSRVELYDISNNGEGVACLHMHYRNTYCRQIERDSAPTESNVGEIIQSDYIVNEEVVANA